MWAKKSSNVSFAFTLWTTAPDTRWMKNVVIVSW